MGAHRLLLKGVAAFEDAYHVPLILSGPGVPVGREVEHVVSLMDMAPTLVGLTTGGEFPCHGRSLLPLLGSEPPAWNSEAFAEFHGQRFFWTQRIVWTDRYKYVFNGFDFDELYDLESDPHELVNLAPDPAYAGVLREMATRMWAHVREIGDDNLRDSHYGMFLFAPVGPAREIQE